MTGRNRKKNTSIIKEKNKKKLHELQMLRIENHKSYVNIASHHWNQWNKVGMCFITNLPAQELTNK